MSSITSTAMQRDVRIPIGGRTLGGTLTVPKEASGLVVFAHGSGSSRFSPRNQAVAERLNRGDLGTLLVDLLTSEEEARDSITAEIRFNIPMLGARVTEVTDWILDHEALQDLDVGIFGASTGAAAALIAASERPHVVSAVVSRGGRPDLALGILPSVKAPTLLIVGGNDSQVIEMNRTALFALRCEKRLEIVPGATHLFQEAGKLERVAELALDWFRKYLSA